MKRGCKGQYSLEFLVTYSWAFLIIGVAMATIYSFGWLNFDQVLPEKCDFYGQIYCSDFEAYGQPEGGENIIELRLVNRFGADLYITNLEIFDGDNRNICVLSPISFAHPNYDLPRDALTWNNTKEIALPFGECEQSATGPSINWEPGKRFKATVNVTFYNPTTADPPSPEDRVTHSQLGTIFIYVREE